MIDQEQYLSIKRIITINEDVIQELNKVFDDKEWDINQGTAFLSNTDNALFIASWDKRIVGFLSAHRLQRFDKRKAEVLLYEVGVLADFRQRGIGKALIEEVKRWAKEVGAAEVWVLTNVSNHAAMALYKSAGGEEDIAGTTMFVYKIAEGGE